MRNIKYCKSSSQIINCAAYWLYFTSFSFMFGFAFINLEAFRGYQIKQKTLGSRGTEYKSCLEYMIPFGAWWRVSQKKNGRWQERERMSLQRRKCKYKMIILNIPLGSRLQIGQSRCPSNLIKTLMSNYFLFEKNHCVAWDPTLGDDRDGFTLFATYKLVVMVVL